MFFM
jgi:regulator of replication initiation timing